MIDAVNALAERLEMVDRGQKLLLEVVNLLQLRVRVLPPIDVPSEQDRMRAVEAEIREAVRWKRGQPEPEPFEMSVREWL